MNVIDPTGLPFIEHAGRDLDHQCVITVDCALMKRRNDQLPLLLVLRAIHARQTEADALLGRASRAANQLTGGAKCCRITKHLPIKFGARDEQSRLARLSGENRTEGCDWTITLVAFAHRIDRIVKKAIVFASGRESGDWRNFHASCVAQMPATVCGKAGFVAESASRTAKTSLSGRLQQSFVKRFRFLRDPGPAKFFFRAFSAPAVQYPPAG